LEVYQLTGKPISHFQQQWNSTPPKDWTVLGLRREKTLESRRINARVKKMLELGLVDEVKSLLAEEKPLSKQAKAAIGYTEVIDYLDGKMDLEEAVERIKINTRRLAKHQRTWFKRFNSVNWIDIPENQTDNEIFEKAIKFLDTKKKLNGSTR
jgi:tRNA dimethylallyltransferase